ncbi:protein of unknown function [Bradyrhizobium sp. ORS 285]|uniref:phage tail tube protein n=1 Tax=Bradyrhizobium sp. ORS 285 TaxID=115808 RepID=UPI0002409598|nr:phage tail tube protein [Bradyrhizobium sp. ORS 285]CCD89852.1 hypothetical protein BRAO285_850057 [Bradyrhizobium sp. ORS 285]SMX61520.1 protein of unknown function [Bradyrhizobium sp. ORS 285]
MAKFTGRQFVIGIGKESVRGTAVSAAYWLPDASLTIDDKIKAAKDETNVYAIEDGVGQEVAARYSEASIEGRITDQSFGAILMAAFGTDTKTTVGGEASVYDHKFTVLQSAQHPSYSISAYSPNEAGGVVYPLGMLDSLDFTFDLEKYAMYKAVFKANKNQSQSNTVSFTSENAFRPQDITLKYAANLAGLGAGTAVQCKKIQVSIKKNTEDDQVLGSIDPVDRLNKQFGITGSFELFYTDRTMIDTIMLGDLAKAIQITVTNAGVTLGTSSNPTLTIRLAKVKLSEVARAQANNGIVKQTVKFQAFYSLSDTEMADITLRNTVSAAY